MKFLIEYSSFPFVYTKTYVELKLSVYSVHSLKVAELQTAVDKVSYEFRQGGGL